MVVTNFDGKNVQIVMEASCLKALRATLLASTKKQRKEAAAAMNFDGFSMTDKDISSFVSVFKHVTQAVSDLVTLTDEDEKLPTA